MIRKFLLAAALSLISSGAFATCGAIPLTIKDASAATQNISSATAADGNCKTYIDADTSSQIHSDMTAALPVRAQNAEQTATTNGSAIGAAADLTGKQIMLPYANPENFLDGTITTAMTGTTDTAVTGMGAQGAGVRVYVTGCVISNSHATVGTDVVLKDGSGGTVLWTFPAAPAYGGVSFAFPTAIKTTANNGLFAANITTGSNTKVSCTGYKGV